MKRKLQIGIVVGLVSLFLVFGLVFTDLAFSSTGHAAPTYTPPISLIHTGVLRPLWNLRPRLGLQNAVVHFVVQTTSGVTGLKPIAITEFLRSVRNGHK